MRQIIFSLQFKGGAVPGSDPGVLKATTSATSCSLQTIIGPGGVESVFHPADGGMAYFESGVTVIGKDTFTESGTISFGEGDDALRFSTLGEGHMSPSPIPGLMAGAVIWKVEGGEGGFAGAS